MALDAAVAAIGRFVLGERRKEPCGGSGLSGILCAGP
jgi:hypothetical protein